MAIVKVFRIEHPSDGHGLYRSRRWSGRLCEYDGDKHPLPHCDSRLCQAFSEKPAEEFYGNFVLCSFQYKFGFIDEAQFRNWFYSNEWLENINDAGYVLKIIEIEEDHVLIGHTQVIYEHEKEISNTVHNIREYFKLTEVKEND